MKWILVAVGIIIALYAILVFAGVFLSPVNLRFYMYPVILLLAGIGIVLVSLGFFPSEKKD